MILIISSENDTMTDEICSWLTHQKKEFVRLNENQKITNISFNYRSNIFKIAINNVTYNLKDFTTFFYRNGTIYYHFWDREINIDLLEFYHSELKSITGFIYYYLRANRAKIFGNISRKEVNKLEVLFLAQALGLKIPDTCIYSELKEILSMDASNRYITKSIAEMKPIFIENELYLNYTCEIDIDKMQDKNETIVPSMIQCKIDKVYEIRVFFWGQRIWAIATFEFTNHVDIRNVKEKDKKYLPYVLPDPIKQKIKKMARVLNLNCGTIDLLKSEEAFYFLEVNPLGQFHQISYYGNYQIEKYIADRL